jgi:hypothetical protein
MPFQFDDPLTQLKWTEYLKRITPTMVELGAFCDRRPQDNVTLLKKDLLDYCHYQNFLSFNSRDALKFYRKALAQEWNKIGEFKSMEEKKVRSIVEAACVDCEAVYYQFDKLGKGLAATQTALQTAISIEKALVQNHIER